MSRMALRPTQPLIQWIPGAVSLGVKWLGIEADYSPPSTAEVKECMELYLHSPSTQLKKSTGTTLPLLLPSYQYYFTKLMCLFLSVIEYS
jgi:hypothetical protein